MERQANRCQLPIQRGSSSEAFPIPETPLKRVTEAAHYCAHRTCTFLSCAFCEQEGHLAAPSLFLDKKKKRRL
jgi:hypothetical protein